MEFDREQEDRNSQDQLKKQGILRFELLKRNEFSSDRKSMSILVRDPIDRKLKLYVKGADVVILNKLDQNGQDSYQSQIRAQIETFVNDASVSGLRTLLFAMKIVDQTEVEHFFAQV